MVWCLVFLCAALGASAGTRAQNASWHGLTFETLTPDKAKKAGIALPFGALITKVGNRSPVRRDLKAGDAIVVVAGKPLQVADALSKALDGLAEGAEIELTRVRANDTRTITLKRPKARKSRVSSSDPMLMLDTGGHMAIVKGIVFARDGKHLVSAGADKVIRVWDLATGKSIRTIRGEVGPAFQSQIYALALSPDGNWLAAAGFMPQRKKSDRKGPGTIRMFDFASGKLVARLVGHTDSVFGLTFSDDGRALVSGSADNSGIVWIAQIDRNGKADWSRAKLDKRLVGHKGRVNAVGFLQGGKLVVTGSYDKTVRIWDRATGKTRARLLGHSNRVYALSVGPSGGIASGRCQW